ncbi:hypothetical protein D9M73_200670 [compost metagenome]
MALITHSLLTTARLETRAKVSTRPPKVSRTEVRERRGPANRNGTTGRMQGLKTVNIPPRKAMSSMAITYERRSGVSGFHRSDRVDTASGSVAAVAAVGNRQVFQRLDLALAVQVIQAGIDHPAHRGCGLA